MATFAPSASTMDSAALPMPTASQAEEEVGRTHVFKEVFRLHFGWWKNVFQAAVQVVQT